MSLLKWLTAGKSLVPWHKSEPKYRVVEESFLPKFGGPSGIVGGAPVGAPTPDATSVGTTLIAKDVVAGGHPLEPKPLVAKESAAPAKVVVRLEDRSEVKRAKEPVRPGAKPYRRLVQGELSLDAVKVVRNDLSDADREVVR